MSSMVFVVIFASTRVLYVCMHPPDASAWLPGLCSFPRHDFGLLTGKFDFIQLFGVFGLCLQTLSRHS